MVVTYSYIETHTSTTPIYMHPHAVCTNPTYNSNVSFQVGLVVL